jgi:hypothetical protein
MIDVSATAADVAAATVWIWKVWPVADVETKVSATAAAAPPVAVAVLEMIAAEDNVVKREAAVAKFVEAVAAAVEAAPLAAVALLSAAYVPAAVKASNDVIAEVAAVFNDVWLVVALV